MWCVTKEQAFMNEDKIDRPTQSFTLSVYGPFLTQDIADKVRDVLKKKDTGYLYIVWPMRVPTNED